MTAKFIYTIFTLIIVPVLIIALLVRFGSPVKIKGGFTRKYLENNLHPTDTIKLPSSSYHIAGKAAGKVYVTKANNVHDLLLVDENSGDTQANFLNTHALGIAHSGVRTIIDSPVIYQHESINSLMLEGTFDTKQFNRTRLPSRPFFNIIPISNCSFAMLCYDTALKQTLFIKANNDSLFPDLQYAPPKNGDGVFSMDGMMEKTREDKGIVYVYYYQNTFIKLDSNLRLQYFANTIDTNKTAKLKLASISSRRSLTLAGPSPYVNKKSCVSDSHLFIYSAASANNEIFKAGFPIDVYFLNDGGYRGSFYLHSIYGKELMDFRVFSNDVYAIFDDLLIKYSFSSPPFWEQ